MEQSSERPRPIGYWLKEADRLITARLAEAQAANGVSRFEWQVRNSIAAAQRASPEGLAAGLHMFLDRTRLDSILAGFQARGWIEFFESAEVTLTDAGRRQHAAVLARQQEVRQRAMDGITSDEYQTVIRVLQRMVANLQQP